MIDSVQLGIDVARHSMMRVLKRGPDDPAYKDAVELFTKIYDTEFLGKRTIETFALFVAVAITELGDTVERQAAKMTIKEFLDGLGDSNVH